MILDEELLNKLKENPLFSEINKEEIRKLFYCMDAKIESYEEGVFFRTEGVPLDFICIILSGEVQIQQHDYDGNRTIAASFTAGEMLGEPYACLGIEVLPVDLYVSKDSTLIILDKERLLAPCGNICLFHHTFIKNVFRGMAKKYLNLHRKVRFMAQKTTKEKLMAYLKAMSSDVKSLEFTIPFDRQELADYLGVERSALSSEISKLQKEGVLISKRSYFKLLTNEE